MLYYLGWIILQPFKLFLKVDGKENIPKKKTSLIVVANHVGELDPLKIGLLFPFSTPIHWFTKKEAYSTKESYLDYKPIFGLFGWVAAIVRKLFVSSALTIPVDREVVGSRTNREAIATSMDLLRSNGVIGIFAEGGIGREGRVHPIFVRLAVKAGCSILPVRIDEKTKRRITFGEPISSDSSLFSSPEYKQDHEKLASKIMDMILKM